MKFTELLAEYQVPEWKSQYVDYKWGKKLLKKIPDDLKDRLKRHNTFNDEIDAPSEPQNIAAQQQAVLVDQTAGEASISPKTVAPAAAAATSPNTGITPGALLGEPSETEPFNSGSENDNYGATESREGSVEDHERHDPQSGGVASHDPNLSPSYMSRERLSRGQSGHPTPILLSKISTSGGDSVKLPRLHSRAVLHLKWHLIEVSSPAESPRLVEQTLLRPSFTLEHPKSRRRSTLIIPSWTIRSQ